MVQTGGGRCPRTRVTIAIANCAATRNLVTGRMVPQPAAQVSAKPLGPDVEMESDLGMGPDKRRAGDSNVAASAAMFEPFSGCKRKRQMHANQHPVLDRFFPL